MSMRNSDLPNRATKMKQKFSENEKRVLVQKIMAHAAELFTKDAVRILGKHISVKRHNIWSLVAEEVSKVNHTRRTVEDCQSAWHNYKRQITRTIDDIKKNFFTTGNVEPLEKILNETQMHVVCYFRMDSDLEMKSQQLSGHSSMEEDSIQNRPVANQLSITPAAGPTEAAPTLQQMNVAASSPSPMAEALIVGTPQCSPSTSVNYTGSSIGRPCENQITRQAWKTVDDHLSLPSEPKPSVHMTPTATAFPTTSPSRISQSHSPSTGQTTPLIQKKRPTQSTSMKSSGKMSAKSLDEKVEKLQSDVRYIQKQLKTVNSKCDTITTLLKNITGWQPK